MSIPKDGAVINAVIGSMVIAVGTAAAIVGPSVWWWRIGLSALVLGFGIMILRPFPPCRGSDNGPENAKGQ